jgi:hypothetical protein
VPDNISGTAEENTDSLMQLFSMMQLKIMDEFLLKNPDFEFEGIYRRDGGNDGLRYFCVVGKDAKTAAKREGFGVPTKKMVGAKHDFCLLKGTPKDLCLVCGMTEEYRKMLEEALAKNESNYKQKTA